MEHVSHFKLLVMLLLTNIKKDKYQPFTFFFIYLCYNFWAGCNTFYMLLFLSLPFLLFSFTWQLFSYWNLKNEIITVWKIYKSHSFFVPFCWSIMHDRMFSSPRESVWHRVLYHVCVCVSCLCVYNVYMYGMCVWSVNV